jgi:hypothetical protein
MPFYQKMVCFIELTWHETLQERLEMENPLYLTAVCCAGMQIDFGALSTLEETGYFLSFIHRPMLLAFK